MNDLLLPHDPDRNIFDQCVFDDGRGQYFSVEKYNSVFDRESNKNCLSVISFNTRSYFSHVDELVSLIGALNSTPDVIVLTETWLSDATVNYCSIDGYKAYNTLRKGDGRGGGVSIFVIDKWQSSFIESLSFSDDTLESCAVTLCNNNEKFLVYGVYRPHSDSITNFTDRIGGILNGGIFKNSKTIVTGDFNINILNSCHEPNNYFLTSMQTLNFLPNISMPTRFSSIDNVAPTLLDHVWTNILESHHSGIILLDITDHCPVFTNIARVCPDIPDRIRITFRDHSPPNLRLFEHILSSHE